MNPVLDTLNAWADHALRFAWPMLWQSSLLIGVLLALDLVLRKKLRSAVRYALWLIVVVKVLLPPSLAFPTSPSWWLRPAKIAPANPRPTSSAVTYSTEDQAALPSAVTPLLETPSRSHLSPVAWTFAGMVSVSLGLFAWMLVRWYQVARDTRRAAAAPAWLGELLSERQRPARIRLIDRPQSPAVCGLFRPVILLPRSLADHLQPAQIRAVLLHELFHMRRGDVWVNCLQTLVQILYWWHPLLWLANARIRRVREEAVDDAVMLALNEDAESYAPTLLEVAKLSLRRPLASLGLVGILESRSSLRQRIERLLDFHPPRHAGLTLGSALALLGFAVVAVPMGQAPAPPEVLKSAGGQAVTNSSASNVFPSPSSLDRYSPSAAAALNTAPPQINVKCKIVEVPQDDPGALGLNLYLGNVLTNNGAIGREADATTPHDEPNVHNSAGVFPGVVAEGPGSNAQPLVAGLAPLNGPHFPLAGILTEPQFSMVIKALQHREGARSLADIGVTSPSGRQVRCKATDIQTVVTGINERALSPPGITSTE